MELERRGAQRTRRGYAEENSSELTGAVIGAAMKVHAALGPGLLESAYEACLCHELAKAGIAFRRQVPVPLRYAQVQLDCGFRIDLLVEDRLIVEIKSVIINFKVAHLRDGFRRKVMRTH